MVTPVPGGRRAIDRVMAPEFVQGLADLPMGELRERRQVAMREEADLSYVRRMLQGRLEILEAELDLTPDETDEQLVARLTRAMMANTTATTSSGHHVVSEPVRLAERRRYVERLISDVGLSDVTTMSETEIRSAVAQLAEQEQIVSRLRHQVHEVIDVLTAELAQRYQSGSV